MTLKVYFNRSFHNIWHLKPVNICTVEAGREPGVPWRDNSTAYRAKTTVTTDSSCYSGPSLNGFPHIYLFKWLNSKNKRWKMEDLGAKVGANLLLPNLPRFLRVFHTVTGNNSGIQS